MMHYYYDHCVAFIIILKYDFFKYDKDFFYSSDHIRMSYCLYSLGNLDSGIDIIWETFFNYKHSFLFLIGQLLSAHSRTFFNINKLMFFA